MPDDWEASTYSIDLKEYQDFLKKCEEKVR